VVDHKQAVKARTQLPREFDIVTDLGKVSKCMVGIVDKLSGIFVAAYDLVRAMVELGRGCVKVTESAQ
jgi:hypothetical protein